MAQGGLGFRSNLTRMRAFSVKGFDKSWGFVQLLASAGLFVQYEVPWL
jgi:hypothetical protein